HEDRYQQQRDIQYTVTSV
ncbi:hypothetical protein SAMD00019534_072000, partial [Acytostelium subglobosum LB1]